MNAIPSRSLAVCLDSRVIGTLTDTNGVWSFSYDRDWQEGADAFDLAPSLPRHHGTITDGSSERPIQWFFDNLLPEELQREVFASLARVDRADSFGLLQYYGAESAGALTLLADPNASLPRGLKPLPDAELARRIEQLPRVSLAAEAPKRMSLAGAQHKLPVTLRNDQLFEPIGQEPSTHILKPQHQDPEQWPHTVANEWFVMQLADLVGLVVPPAQIRHVPHPVYLVERFDRRREGDSVQRLHIVDACQLLGISGMYKYRECTVGRLVECVDRCRDKARTRSRLFRWTVFNVLTGNGHAHLKNLSFFASSGGFYLAPFYDLVSTSVYRLHPEGHGVRWEDAELTMPIGAASRFGTVSREDLLSFSEALGIPRKVAMRLLDEMLLRLNREMPTLIERFERARVGTASPLQHAAALRIVRQIAYAVVQTMIQRISAGTAPQ